MDPYSQLLEQVFYEELLTPALLSLCLVLSLFALHKDFKKTSRSQVCVLFAIGFMLIIGWPHAWQMMFPEVCIPPTGTPQDACHLSPWTRLKLGLLSGACGALLALMAVKAWQFTARKLK